ncbi:hypothetical protein [Staphylococcus simulans]|nr:hypothetical protein [Staphylococcus simulans]
MYKNYNMSQLSLPLTTDFTFSKNNTALIVYEIAEGISGSVTKLNL